MIVVKNSKNKKVAEVDKANKTVFIKSKECMTMIRFTDENVVEIKNTKTDTV